MDKVRLGIIGLGNQGKYYTKILTGETKSPYQPDNMVIGDAYPEEQEAIILYRFNDIYNQHYWTEPLT